MLTILTQREKREREVKKKQKRRRNTPYWITEIVHLYRSL